MEICLEALDLSFSVPILIGLGPSPSIYFTRSISIEILFVEWKPCLDYPPLGNAFTPLTDLEMLGSHSYPTKLLELNIVSPRGQLCPFEGALNLIYRLGNIPRHSNGVRWEEMESEMEKSL